MFDYQLLKVEKKIKNLCNRGFFDKRHIFLFGVSDNTRQTITGDHNTQVAGHGNNINSSEDLSKALDEIAEHRKLLAKSQEQIDRLLAIIEKMSK